MIGEKLGLTFGLLLTAVGLLIVLILPARPGSVWKTDGWRPKRSGGPPIFAANSLSQNENAAENDATPE